VILRPQANDVPTPVPTLVSRPFWEGCQRGELLFQRCATCGWAIHTPAVLCGNCWGRQLSWEASNGTGEIYSWTVVWRPQTPAFSVPYAPVIVTLDEGWQMLSCMVGCAIEEVSIGLRAEVEFFPTASGFRLPYFHPM
jgi:uncharacterized OB-fold protein